MKHSYSIAALISICCLLATTAWSQSEGMLLRADSLAKYEAGFPLNNNGRIRVEDRLVGKTLALRINGASDIFLDSVKIGGSPHVPFQVIPFVLHDTLPHLLRCKNFQMWIGTYNQLSSSSLNRMSSNSVLLASIGAQVALALLHLVLFCCYPQQKSNLYYSLFVLFAAFILFLRYTAVSTSSTTLPYMAASLFEPCIIIDTFFAGLLLYSVSYDALPGKRVWIIAVSGVALLLATVSGYTTSMLENLYFVLVVTDGFRALVGAMSRNKSRIWLVGLGMLVVTLFYLLVGSDVLGLMKGNNFLIAQGMSIGLLAIPLSFSIYLALEFADTNHRLTAKLAEVQAHESEKRKLLAEQTEKLERTVEKRTREVKQQADKLKEMDAIKSRFTVNLTHEFRTPLSLILGPAEQIAQNAVTATDRQQAMIIHNNAEKLLQLINQLLDLNRLEEGKMELVNIHTDVLKLFEATLQLFAGIAIQKEISISFQSNVDQLSASLDAQKLEMILSNLVSNAIKFNSFRGKITVTVTAHNSSGIQIIVSDTGIGIPAAKLSFVFDRFYQVDVSDTRAREGSGIGLALTRELVLLLGGSIEINSLENVGTSVQVSLPVNDLKVVDGEKYVLLSTPLPENALPETSVHSDAMVVLVIEDNHELLNFIASVLSASYHMLKADNGKEALQLAAQHVPDLIITDLMMPGMSGYEVCTAIKEYELTSHIPVMMLTAKSATDSKIKGWESGADAYLTKPFHTAELLALVNSLMITRKRLYERYRKEEAWNAGKESLPSQDQLFVTKIRNLIEEHLADEQFGVEMLCSLIGLSRTQLHRKLKGCVGESPGNLIRMIRLQRALMLLQNDAGNVSEVAYSVGFGSPANFSTSFSGYFGYPPGEVKRR
jgi:signal transduction histidine kinase/DNA-binding response OmpR family regulator